MPKMKSYATFDLYLADQKPLQRRLIAQLRSFVRRVAPKLQEAVKWSNGCWIQIKDPVSYVYAGADYVQFGFVRGATLRDPHKLLEGEGAYVRHIKVREAADIDEPKFAALLRQALRADRERMASEGKPAAPKKPAVKRSRRTPPRTRGAATRRAARSSAG